MISTPGSAEIQLSHRNFIGCPWSNITEQLLDIPPRSRLYRLTPRGVGTVWIECLTSYTNRLGWIYRVSPKALVAQEIVPTLGRAYPHQYLGTCCRGGWFMNANGNGSLALDWSTILEQLTLGSDLHMLTLHGYLGDLASRGHLRVVPSWCPICYNEWKEQGSTIYQPLLWMLRIVTICVKHKRSLEDHCPHCQKKQSIITLKTYPGHCTQCNTWLGTSLEMSNQILDNETIVWQEWVIRLLEELYMASSTLGSLSWKSFFMSIAACMKEIGMCSKLAHLSGIERTRFYTWIDDTPEYTPTLETILNFCYSLDLTPLQIMMDQSALLKLVHQSEVSPQYPRYSHPTPQRVDRERCLELINAVLEGREQLLGVTQIAKRLHYTEKTLKFHFPQECLLITAQAREYRQRRKQQRVTQVCKQVQQAIITLHNQGIFPSQSKINKLLTNPNFMLMPEAREAKRATFQELGIEQ